MFRWISLVVLQKPKTIAALPEANSEEMAKKAAKKREAMAAERVRQACLPHYRNRRRALSAHASRAMRASVGLSAWPLAKRCCCCCLLAVVCC